jgi:ferredoxin
MGKRIDVDRSRCIAVGACEATAPHLFQVDDDGVLHVLKQQAGEADLADASRAVQGCPTEALSVVEDRGRR